MKEAAFTIYNASAGSGKTFTLVKNYLSIVLSDQFADSFKHVLAITFTNKAVGEMKERIIENLSDFANNEAVASENFMFTLLCKELNVPEEVLRTKARKVLLKILHNYAFFEVSTIDKFNHRIIRTFAFDLNLPQNFEVALETDLLLKEAVDNLIANAGEDAVLTKVLTDFVLEKVDDDKSWDIARDILDASSKIVQENHFKPLATLKNKTVEDFRVLQKKVKTDTKALENSIKTEAANVLRLIADNGLAYSDFSRGTLPNHFEKHTTGDYPPAGPYGNKLEENLQAGSGIYPAKLSSAKAVAIDGLLPEITASFFNIKKWYYRLKFLQNIYKNLVPLTVINSVQQELQKIKDDENLVLISEFNATISETIAGQPAPFIYERLGEKFRYYFIDEFQDTSEMQWNNLVPLIDSALSGETLGGQKGSLLLVGDAKQAIYRWRGGNPEQFINLFNQQTNPFVLPASLQNLETNYRSYDQIITFNNHFFEFAKNQLPNAAHRELYSLGIQKTNNKQGGLVSVEFVEKDEEETEEEKYLQATLQAVHKAHQDGYAYKDIAVLTRTNRHGVLVAGVLAEAGVPIVSSETLLLANNPKILFLNTLIKFGLYPENTELKAQLLMYLAGRQQQQSAYAFTRMHLDLPEGHTFEAYNFTLKAFLQRPFYEAMLYAIHQFNLADASDAYLQYYLDLILKFTLTNQEGLAAFVSYWEEKGHKTSLVAPEGMNAVSLYTVHRSKGLEFPVVIYPFADDSFTDARTQLWVPVNPEEFNGFETLLVNANKDFAELTEETTHLKAEAEARTALDTLNVIYVAFTRAVSRLHIITTAKSKENNLSYLLKTFAEQKQGKATGYMELYGNAQEIPATKQPEIMQHSTIPFGAGVSKKEWNVVTRNGMLWDTRQEQAIEKGNVIHKILAWVKTPKDIDFAIEEAVTGGLITKTEEADIKQTIVTITSHPELSAFFSEEDYTIYNEKEIITAKGEILRPDRLLLSGNKAVIIDYKTGEANPAYHRQLLTYSQALEAMQFTHIRKVLVYIFPELKIDYC